MAQDIVKIERIRALDRVRPHTTLSLPEWLQRSLTTLRAGLQAETWMRIPESQAPTEAQRVSICSRIEDLRAAELAVNVDGAMAHVTELLLSFPAQATSPAAAKMRAKSYMTALDDVPDWAVAEGCRRWLRGDCGDANYDFAPSAPRLRAVCRGVLNSVSAQRWWLEKLLSATLEREYSDEYRGEMLAKLQGVMNLAAIPQEGEKS